MSDTKALKKIKPFELACYIVTGLVAVWGIVYIVLGLIAHFPPDFDCELIDANSTIKKLFGLDMLYWGLIILAIAVVTAVVVLCLYARTYDREYEKAQRRAARLESIRKAEEKSAEKFPTENVVAEVNPDEAKAEEPAAPKAE